MNKDSIDGYIPSSVFYRGKCDTCQQVKPLDEMIRKFGRKGLYHCVDCELMVETGHEVEDIRAMWLWWLPQEDVSSKKVKVGSPISFFKVKRLVAWCFG